MENKSGRKWTQEDDDYILSFGEVCVSDLEDISKFLNRSKSAVKQRCTKVLNIYKKKDYKIFTEEELKFINCNYLKLTSKEIAEKLNTTEAVITNKKSSLGLQKYSIEEWSDSDIEILKKWYNVKTIHEISTMLNRKKDSLSAIYSKARALGLTKNTMWTDDEIKKLHKYYNDNYSKEQLVKLFPNRTYSTIKGKGYSLGLIRNDYWSESEDNIILNNWEKLEDFQLQYLLPKRTHRSIKWRRQELGLSREVSSGLGICMTSLGGDFCHSLSECKLLDYIYNKNLEYKKDVPYSELINNDESARTCDVCIYLGDVIYAIEYFGMFRKNPRNDMESAYVEKMAYKCDSFKYNKKDNIIFIQIYPDDITQRDAKKMKNIIDNLKKEK